MRRGLTGALVAALVIGCATAPERVHRRAADLGYTRVDLRGVSFEHVAFFKDGAPEAALHVYIEHDGLPWVSPTRPSDDPTPRRLVMLEMMARDPAPSLYLGRPCYFGLATKPPCEPVWWTHRRFSPEVVDSMSAALSRFIAQRPVVRDVEIYGYSGGGVLAVLVAPSIAEARRVVTIAAPLDIEAWTARHGYSPLVGSLNPVKQPPLPSAIAQLHVLGENDDVVTTDMIQGFVDRQANAQLRTMPRHDHYCCWQSGEGASPISAAGPMK